MLLLGHATVWIWAGPKKALSVVSQWSVCHRILLVADFIATTCSVRIPPDDPLVVQDASDEIDCFGQDLANLVGCLEVARGPGREVAVGKLPDVDGNLAIIEGDDEITDLPATCRHAQCPVGIALEVDAGQPKPFHAAAR